MPEITPSGQPDVHLFTPHLLLSGSPRQGNWNAPSLPPCSRPSPPAGGAQQARGTRVSEIIKVTQSVTPPSFIKLFHHHRHRHHHHKYRTYRYHYLPLFLQAHLSKEEWQCYWSLCFSCKDIKRHCPNIITTLITPFFSVSSRNRNLTLKFIGESHMAFSSNVT